MVVLLLSYMRIKNSTIFHTKKLLEIRNIIPNHFLLVPGVGAQGGNIHDVSKYGMNSECGLLVNSSRAILYAGSELDFAEKSRMEAQKLQKDMASVLSLLEF